MLHLNNPIRAVLKCGSAILNTYMGVANNCYLNNLHMIFQRRRLSIHSINHHIFDRFYYFDLNNTRNLQDKCIRS